MMKKKTPLIFLVLALIAVGIADSSVGNFLADIAIRIGTLFPQSQKETITIATWNIENFGRKKASDSGLMDEIALILKDYDIIAVQEISNIREMSDEGCPRNEGLCPGDPSCGIIVSALNGSLNSRLGLNYSFLMSPQAKDERYLFIYNASKISADWSLLMEDPEDENPPCSLENNGLMVRQPFAAKFSAGEFDFVLLNVHTSPSINIQELDAIDYFRKEAEKLGEPDVIIIGDLNADCSYLGEYESVSLRTPEYSWAVPNSADTTISKTDCAYDRIIFTIPAVENYAGVWGVDRRSTGDMSDHYLVWAKFYTEGDSG